MILRLQNQMKNKLRLLENYKWYRSMEGNFIHPHAIDYMSVREVKGYSLKELEYKLQHGSKREITKRR